jgi:methanogenic corrinoid protein MtbC1
MSSQDAQASAEARHSIAVVSRQTGLTQLLLRAWERRYGAVEPARTPTGRRLYTDADLKKLRLLKLLTEADHRIGDVANMPVAELEELAVQATTLPPSAPRPADPYATPDRMLSEALQAVADLDGGGLERVLQQASVAFSRPVLRRELLAPLLYEIGDRWRAGRIRVAHEHMATAIVRTFLAGLGSHSPAPAGAPVMVAGTPQGQVHELGLLMATSQAEEAGWNVYYLGANLPAEEMAAVALMRDARGVLLSLVFPSADPGTAAELRNLRRAMGPDPFLLVGGAAAGSYRDVLSEIGARLVTDTDVLDQMLREMA